MISLFKNLQIIQDIFHKKLFFSKIWGGGGGGARPPWLSSGSATASTSPYMRSNANLGQTQLHNSPFLSQYQWLSSIPQPEEITRNVFSLPWLKALGPDGYHAIFFQKNWHIVRPSVIQVIQEIFENQVIPPNWGITNLVLIPKVAYLEMITQFRSISL